MDYIRKFRNRISILMLYATNLIIHDRIVLPERSTVSDLRKRISGTVFLKLPEGRNT